MSDISPIGRFNPAALNRAGKQELRPTVGHAGQSRGRDQVEFSRTAQLLSRMAELPDVRQELVNRVRSEIEAGTYETPEKVDAAVDNLVEDLV